MTASQAWSLSGASLATLGVALTLYGLKRIRDVLRRFTEWVSGRMDPATIYAEAATVGVTVTSRARGRVRAGPVGWSDERWHEELDKRIDAVLKELDEHRHKGFEKSIETLRNGAKRQHKDFTNRISAFENETEVNERWNVAGLSFVLAGTIAQIIAVIVA